MNQLFNREELRTYAKTSRISSTPSKTLSVLAIGDPRVAIIDPTLKHEFMEDQLVLKARQMVENNLIGCSALEFIHHIRLKRAK